MTSQSLKTGTRIETHGIPGMGGFPAVSPERATIARWTKACGPVPNEIRGNGGWHIVRFADGGQLCVHESRFRVADNRAA